MPDRRILILDDDEAVGQTIQWIAENLGFEAEFVTHPDEFFKRLAQTSPDIITIDLAMPELDGVEIMRLLAERQCESKIIISSGMGTRVLDAAQRSASEHGLSIAGVISKPISKEAMRSLIGQGSDLNPSALPKEPCAERDKFVVTKSDIESALEHHEFFLAYQPKILCKSGEPAGFEALVRWQHPAPCIIMPDNFIPVAEQAGLIDVLTGQIFNQSLEWFSQSFFGANLKLSLNISAKSLVDIHRPHCAGTDRNQRDDRPHPVSGSDDALPREGVPIVNRRLWHRLLVHGSACQVALLRDQDRQVVRHERTKIPRVPFGYQINH